MLQMSVCELGACLEMSVKVTVLKSRLLLVSATTPPGTQHSKKRFKLTRMLVCAVLHSAAAGN